MLSGLVAVVRAIAVRVLLAVVFGAIAFVLAQQVDGVQQPSPTPAARACQPPVVPDDVAVRGGWPLAAARLSSSCGEPLRELGRQWEH